MKTGWNGFWDVKARFLFVATGEPITSGSVVSGSQIASFRLFERSSGSSSALAPIYTVGATDVQAKSCSVRSGSTVLSVPLGQVNVHDFGSVGTTAGSGIFNIVLENCSPGLRLFATFTDRNNSANNTDVLSLTSGNQAATGVGIRILTGSGSTVKFGPDSSSPGTANQLSLGTSGAGIMTFPFTATYVKTAITIGGGIANGNATFTFSYQ